MKQKSFFSDFLFTRNVQSPDMSEIYTVLQYEGNLGKPLSSVIESARQDDCLSPSLITNSKSEHVFVFWQENGKMSSMKEYL